MGSEDSQWRKKWDQIIDDIMEVVSESERENRKKVQKDRKKTLKKRRSLLDICYTPEGKVCVKSFFEVMYT